MRLKPLGASIYIEVKKRSDLEKILTHYKKANWKRPNNRDTRAMANELFTKNKSIFISAGIPHCENSVVFPCLTPRSITHKNTIITPEEFFHRRRCPEFQNSQRKRPKLLNILSVKNQTPDNASPPKHLTSNQGGTMSNAKKKKEIAAKKANAAKNRKGKGKAPLSPSNKKLNNSAPGTKAGKKGRQKNKEKRRERNKR